MKNKPPTMAALATFGAAPTGAEGIQITPNGASPSTIGSTDYFTGHVVVVPLFPATEFTHGTGGHVTFAPGARTAWHTHPAGQTLMVTSGKGWVQEEGRERHEIKAGDVVWFPAGVKHWHGATDTTGMSHIAISYMLGGKNVDWLEQVSPEQYQPSVSEQRATA
ncbi:(R)-mandelonitrile lyase [Mesorhizobium sp. LjNodule214]|uniref:(R)-mandelonitrile lyase n=1 Tax=Mesorhizobium sp. LjNodule214 TaxID=3342252 RepID=UPI003ECEEAF2